MEWIRNENILGSMFLAIKLDEVVFVYGRKTNKPKIIKEMKPFNLFCCT